VCVCVRVCVCVCVCVSERETLLCVRMRERDREEKRAREKEICRVDTVVVHYNTSHIQQYTAKHYTNRLQHMAYTPIHRNTIQQCTATQDVVSRAVAVHYRVHYRV